jgi:hypothetical protein
LKTEHLLVVIFALSMTLVCALIAREAAVIAVEHGWWFGFAAR